MAHGTNSEHYAIDPPNSLLLFFVLCSSLSFFFHVIERRTPSPALSLFPPIFLVISLQTQASSLTPSPAICKIVSYNELQMSWMCKATISNSTLQMNLNITNLSSTSRLRSSINIDLYIFLSLSLSLSLSLGHGSTAGGS